MRKEIEALISDIPQIELENFAYNILKIEKQNSINVHKTNIILDILDKLFDNYTDDEQRYEWIKSFCLKGDLLFFPMKFLKSGNLYPNRIGEEIKGYKLYDSHNQDFIYHPDNLKSLLLEPSIFFPKDKKYLIFFKKYNNKELKFRKKIKRLESLFNFKLEKYWLDELRVELFKKIKNDNLMSHCKRKNSKGNDIILELNYISHGYQSQNITNSSKLTFYKKDISKDITKSLSNKLYSSVDANIRFKTEPIPDDVKYYVNKFNFISQSTLLRVGFNMKLYNDIKDSLLYTFVLKRYDCRLINYDVDLVDVKNLVELLPYVKDNGKEL